MTPTAFASILPTPLGPFAYAVDDRGALVATAFGGLDALSPRAPSFEFVEAADPGARVRSQVTEYFAGRRRDFDLPLAAAGSAFQARVWAALRKIPFGRTTTYGALAAELGSSPRAVGRANATNPICLVVPCHRVIGTDGSLTGFAFGEPAKRWLLEHEARLAARPLEQRGAA